MDNIKIVKQFIKELRADNSSNYKLEVLEKYKDYEIVKKVLYYTYNTRYQFFIKQIPEPMVSRVAIMTEADMFNLLDELRLRKITGNSARDRVKVYLESMYEDMAEIFKLILGRDIKCGVSTKSINKIIPNLIPTTPYMRCSKLDEKTVKKFEESSDPLITQKKSDGAFSYIIIEDSIISCLTRNGSPWYSKTLQDTLKYITEDLVLIGEALIYDNWGKEVDRKTGNGLINKLIKKEASLLTLNEKVENASTRKQAQKAESNLILKLEELEQIDEALGFECWDLLTLEEFENSYSPRTYDDRFKTLSDLVFDIDDSKVSLIETHYVNSVEEARQIGQDYINRGYEGAILKLPTMEFENKTSKDQLKIKQILDCDLVCVGYEEGTGKYEGKIGALILRSSCGNLEVKVGTGLTDEDREKPAGHYAGRIIEVQYNEKIKSKGKDTWSLFLPVFVEIRYDKDVADSLEAIE